MKYVGIGLIDGKVLSKVLREYFHHLHIDCSPRLAKKAKQNVQCLLLMYRLAWCKEEFSVLSNLCRGTPGKQCPDRANIETSIPSKPIHQVLALRGFGVERSCSNHGFG